MTVVTILDYLRDRRAILKKAFFLFLAVLVAIDILLPRERGHYFVDTIYAYWTFFAVGGCYVLIRLSKGIAHLFLSRDDDYYG